MNDTSEADLKELLRTAAQGDFEASKALGKLAHQDQHIRTRALPVFLQHFQLPSPPCLPAPSITQEEWMAGQALHILASRADEEHSDIEETVMLSDMDDLLRWMNHFFTKWVFDLPLERLRTLSPSCHSFHEGFARTSGLILQRMTKYPTVLDAMNDHAQVGTLFAQMIMVANRDRRPELIEFLTEMQATMAGPEFGLDKPYKLGLHSFLELHSDAFAGTAISHLKDYSCNAAMARKPYASTVVLRILSCVADRDECILLDACLGKTGFIQALVFLLLRATEHLEDFTLSWDQQKENSMKLMIAIPRILWLGFSRAGAPPITLALRDGLLRAIISMLRLFSLSEIAVPDIAPIDKPLSDMVDTIVFNMVYPSVFKAAFSTRYTMYTLAACQGLPSRSTSTNGCLMRLFLRFDEECQILGRDYTKLHKFCDNAECPNSWDTSKKLGRCTTCSSGYYCSRSCQKVVWKNGHREECKKLSAIMRDGKVVFPPVLTIHDIEYFKRTLPNRLRFYREKSQVPKTAENTVVCMDLTTFPVTFSACDFDEARSEDCSGLLVRAKIPTGTKLGDGMEITLHSDYANL